MDLFCSSVNVGCDHAAANMSIHRDFSLFSAAAMSHTHCQRGKLLTPLSSALLIFVPLCCCLTGSLAQWAPHPRQDSLESLHCTTASWVCFCKMIGWRFGGTFINRNHGDIHSFSITKVTDLQPVPAVIRPAGSFLTGLQIITVLTCRSTQPNNLQTTCIPLDRGRKENPEGTHTDAVNLARLQQQRVVKVIRAV